MLAIDARDMLVLAHERARNLRERAAALPSRRRPTRGLLTSRVLATFLRRVADRIDPAPFAPRHA